VVHCQDQAPAIMRLAVLGLHAYGVRLGVRVDARSEVLDAVTWTTSELQHAEDHDEDVVWSKHVSETLRGMHEDGSLLDRASKTKYSKRIHL
jgi:hypothetical protein